MDAHWHVPGEASRISVTRVRNTPPQCVEKQSGHGHAIEKDTGARLIRRSSLIRHNRRRPPETRRGRHAVPITAALRAVSERLGSCAKARQRHRRDPEGAWSEVSSTFVLIPAFNEAENLLELLPRVLEQATLIRGELRVLVVDDGSRDGTADVVREVSAGREALQVVTLRTNRA
jgi:hypothetical protein